MWEILPWHWRWSSVRSSPVFCLVDERTSSLRKVLMSLSQNNGHWEAKSEQIEKMFQRMAVLQLILYIKIKRGDLRRVTWNSMVVDWGRGRKQSGKSLRWKEKQTHTRYLYTGGHKLANIYRAGRRVTGNRAVACSGPAVVPSRGLGKKITLHFKGILP